MNLNEIADRIEQLAEKLKTMESFSEESLKLVKEREQLRHMADAEHLRRLDQEHDNRSKEHEQYMLESAKRISKINEDILDLQEHRRQSLADQKLFYIDALALLREIRDKLV